MKNKSNDPFFQRLIVYLRSNVFCSLGKPGYLDCLSVVSAYSNDVNAMSMPNFFFCLHSFLLSHSFSSLLLIASCHYLFASFWTLFPDSACKELEFWDPLHWQILLIFKLIFRVHSQNGVWNSMTFSWLSMITVFPRKLFIGLLPSSHRLNQHHLFKTQHFFFFNLHGTFWLTSFWNWLEKPLFFSDRKLLLLRPIHS